MVIIEGFTKLRPLLCQRALVIFVFLSGPLFGQQFRTINGSGNNLDNPESGMTGVELRRYTPASYSNGYDEPNGANRPNIREISNRLFSQSDFIGDPGQLSDFVWLFGQFLDHDISLNPDSEGEEMSIPIPAGDEFFDPDNTGTKEFRVNRGLYNHETGTEPSNPRQQLNMITAFVDASAVYGSTDQVASWLRSHEQGRLKSSIGNFLPFNTTDGAKSGPIDSEAPFMATGLDLKAGDNSFEMKLAKELPTGVYLVSLLSSSGNGALRLIKQ